MGKDATRPKHMRTPGAGADERPAPNGIYFCYVCVLLAVLVAPLALMPLVAEDSSASEKRELAPAPSLMVDGKPNLSFLSQAGDYLSDHFAFRSALVDLDATLKQRVFLTSSTSNVVVGTDGWLYYAGTMSDYQRTNPMTDQALQNAAHNIALMQEYFNARGKRFVLAIAPNKNELYSSHLPYYEWAGEGPSNFDRLVPLLDERGVNYTNLHDLFRQDDRVLYFERDSHWTDAGSLVAYDAIMQSLDRAPMGFGGGPKGTDDHTGDVDLMLHPLFALAETQSRLKAVDRFDMVNDATSVEDSYIVTNSRTEGAQGSLMMYRDSFGNNLLLPFACTYEQAVFTKLVPYDMGLQMTGFADDVVVERTERHLAFFATDPPYLPAPERDIIEGQQDADLSATIQVSYVEPYLVVQGTLDQAAQDLGKNVYVSVAYPDGSQKYYEAFRVSVIDQGSEDTDGSSADDEGSLYGDRGYRVYVPLNAELSIDELDIGVCVGDDTGAMRISTDEGGR